MRTKYIVVLLALVASMFSAASVQATLGTRGGELPDRSGKKSND